MKDKVFPNIKHTHMKFTHLLQTKTGKLFLATGFTFPLFNNVQLALIIFMISFAADFATGVLASYIEVKNGTKKMPKSGRVFNSEEARRSTVKFVGYTMFILCAYGLEILFFNKSYSFSGLSTKSLTITEIAIGISTAFEMYSVVVENLKRAGFDILGQAKTISTSLSSIYKKITEQWQTK